MADARIFRTQIPMDAPGYRDLPRPLAVLLLHSHRLRPSCTPARDAVGHGHGAQHHDEDDRHRSEPGERPALSGPRASM